MRSVARTAEEAPLWKARSTVSESSQEVVKPRLSLNDIYSISDDRNQAIMHVSRGSGYTQFGGLAIPVRMTWPMSQALYKERSRRPWPVLNRNVAGVHHNLKSTNEIEEEVRRENIGRLQTSLADLFKHFKELGG